MLATTVRMKDQSLNRPPLTFNVAMRLKQVIVCLVSKHACWTQHSPLQ